MNAVIPRGAGIARKEAELLGIHYRRSSDCTLRVIVRRLVQCHGHGGKDRFTVSVTVVLVIFAIEVTSLVIFVTNCATVLKLLEFAWKARNNI